MPCSFSKGETDMALNPSDLQTKMSKEMVSALDSAFGAGEKQSKDYRKKFCDALAKACAKTVVDHIMQMGEVNGTCTVTVVPGIPVATAGSPAAQTGATTGPGTGTGTITGKIL
jgi:hypothetical protein